METSEIIKDLCSKKGITISQLESALGYGNGSVAKSKNMSGERMYQIAKYLGVTVEYLMTGKTIDEVDNEMKLITEQKAILVEISQVSQQISDLQSHLAKLKIAYNNLEQKRVGIMNNGNRVAPTPPWTPPIFNPETLPVQQPPKTDNNLPFFFADEYFNADNNAGG